MDAEAHAKDHEPRDLRELVKELIQSGKYGSQQEIAIKMGITPSALSQVLNPENRNPRGPSVDFLRDVAVAMGGNLKWLLRRGRWIPGDGKDEIDIETAIQQCDELDDEDKRTMEDLFRILSRRKREREQGMGRGLR